MKTLAFTAVSLLSFAALPAVAQDPIDTEADVVEEVVEDIVDPDLPPPPVRSDLPVTLPDPASVPPPDPQRRLDTPEAVFIADALREGEMEIASAQLARDRSETDEVRALAERLEHDHETLNDRLRGLQEADAATEPRGRPAHPEMDRLRVLEDAAFDAGWLAVEAKHHRMAIDKYERASLSPAFDVGLRSAAAGALTMLRSHADAIADLQDSLGYE